MDPSKKTFEDNLVPYAADKTPLIKRNSNRKQALEQLIEKFK